MSMGDDPHFSVVLPGGEVLCYTVHGDHHHAYNLLSTNRMQINGRFVPDATRKEATWIGSLAIVFLARDSRKTFLQFKTIGSTISINERANLSAKNIDSIAVKGGTFKLFEATPTDEFRYPQVRVELADVGVSFSVVFKREHLDLLWHHTKHRDQPTQHTHGLIGQFFRKGVELDMVRGFLLLPGMEPVPVARQPVWRYMQRSVQTSQMCWVAMNYGYQGEGLIIGSYKDYEVENMVEADFESEMK